MKHELRHCWLVSGSVMQSEGQPCPRCGDPSAHGLSPVIQNYLGTIHVCSGCQRRSTDPSAIRHIRGCSYQRARRCQIRVYVGGTRHDPGIADGSIVSALSSAGLSVVSRWHDQPPGDVDGTPESRRRTAMANYGDIDLSHVVLAVSHPEHHLRGVHVEIGYAIGTGKEVFLLGDFNTMTEHPDAIRAPSLQWFISNVGAML